MAIRISKNVVRSDGRHWHVYQSIEGVDKNITGKYLFFSEDINLLEEIAIEEIDNHGFSLAKISTEQNKKGEEHVLCLYHKDDSRKQELAERHRKSKVKYRYWKSDEDTLKGKYSEQFLSKLSPEERERWTRDRTKNK